MSVMNTSSETFGAETFSAGKTIFRQGDVPDKFYIITSGRVNIIYRTSDDRDILINVLGPGDYFGEIGMVRGVYRVATVQAASDVAVMEMGQELFVSWLGQSSLNRDEINTLIARRTANVDSLTYLPLEKAAPDIVPQMDSSEIRRTLARSRDETTLRTFAAGEIITEQGDEADYFYILVEGEVEVLAKDGSLIAILKSGSYFGEMGLMEDRLRSATIRTLTPVQVIVFDKKTFTDWMEDSPFSQSSIKETVEKRRRV